MLKVYGLKNCDTCRKALKWLEAEAIGHTFLDVRKDGVTRADVEGWADAVGVDVLLNRRGTTWRKLSDAEKAQAEKEADAISLMTSQPSLIKRPVFVDGTNVLVGFTDDVREKLKV
jgi:arsenate reductase